MLKTILKKELTAIIRSKRAIGSIIIAPLSFFPAMAILINYMSTSEISATSNPIIGIEGYETWDSSALNKSIQSPIVKIINPTKAVEALESSQIDVFITSESENGTIEYSIEYTGRQIRSVAIANEISNAISSQRADVVQKENRDLPGQPFSASLVEVSGSNSDKYLMYQGFIPMIIVICSCMGASSVAGHVSVGEKERGTLEALLSTGVDKSTIVLGKYFSTLVVSTISTISSLVGIQLCDVIYSDCLHFSINQLLLLLLASMLISLFVSTILICVGFSSHTYREYQTISGVLTTISMIPMYLLYNIPLGSESPVLWITPIVNCYCLLRAILAAIPTNIYQILMISLTTIALTALGIWFSASSLSQRVSRS